MHILGTHDYYIVIDFLSGNFVLLKMSIYTPEVSYEMGRKLKSFQKVGLLQPNLLERLYRKLYILAFRRGTVQQKETRWPRLMITVININPRTKTREVY